MLYAILQYQSAQNYHANNLVLNFFIILFWIVPRIQSLANSKNLPNKNSNRIFKEKHYYHWQNVFVCYYTDDECFYVGLGHTGRSARKGNNYVPNQYRPFQCCPTKLERSTKVPKMTAQRIGHQKTDSRGGNFQFSTPTSKPSSQTSKPTVPLSKTPPAKSSTSTKKALPSPSTTQYKRPETPTVKVPAIIRSEPLKSKSSQSSSKGGSKSQTSKKALASNKNGKESKFVKEGMFGIGKYIFW